MAVGEKLLVSIELVETDHDRNYWLSRPYSAEPQTRDAAQAADVLLFPWEHFRDEHNLFPQGSANFFKFLAKKLPDKSIAVAMDRDKYKEITLHAHEFRLPSVLVKEALVAIVVNIAVDFLALHHADPVNDIVQFEISVDSQTHPCIAIKYKGPANQLSERILAEVDRCFGHSIPKGTRHAASEKKSKSQTRHGKKGHVKNK